MKSQVYANNPQNIHQLQEEIKRVFGGIGREVCAKVITNFKDRIITCRDRGGGHLLAIIFHH